MAAGAPEMVAEAPQAACEYICQKSRGITPEALGMARAAPEAPEMAAKAPGMVRAGGAAAEGGCTVGGTGSKTERQRRPQ